MYFNTSIQYIQNVYLHISKYEILPQELYYATRFSLKESFDNESIRKIRDNLIKN